MLSDVRAEPLHSPNTLRSSGNRHLPVTSWGEKEIKKKERGKERVKEGGIKI